MPYFLEPLKAILRAPKCYRACVAVDIMVGRFTIPPNVDVLSKLFDISLCSIRRAAQLDENQRAAVCRRERPLVLPRPGAGIEACREPAAAARRRRHRARRRDGSSSFGRGPGPVRPMSSRAGAVGRRLIHDCTKTDPGSNRRPGQSVDQKLRGLTAPPSYEGAVSMPKLNIVVNSRGARWQSPTELEAQILAYRRIAARRHLSEREWMAIDHLRNRLAKLNKEAGI